MAIGMRQCARAAPITQHWTRDHGYDDKTLIERVDAHPSALGRNAGLRFFYRIDVTSGAAASSYSQETIAK
jgi:hypothetical protein